MVVDDLDMPRRAVAPDEADAPSVVDANAVLTPAIAPQSLQSIAGRCAQVVEPADRIKRQKLHPCALLARSRQAASRMASEDGSGVLVGEAPDHGCSVTNADTFSQALRRYSSGSRCYRHARDGTHRGMTAPGPEGPGCSQRLGGGF